MLTYLPQHPLYQADTYVSLTTAYATLPLSIFLVYFEFDTAALSYVSFEQSSYFASFTVSTDDVGKVKILGNGKSSSATDAQVTGLINPFLEITWAVTNTATQGSTYDPALRVNLNKMQTAGKQIIFDGTTNPYQTVESTAAASAAGASTNGKLQVGTAGSVLGIYAYLAQAELFNTAKLTGTSVSTTATVLTVVTQKVSDNSISWNAATPAGAPTCTFSDAAVAGAAASSTNCAVTVTSANTAGSGSTTLS
eukprot:3987459-Pyramimonas_sp.AAC.1